ncbi:hypothetical protein AKJ51_03300 [candidate division MSBL1 archaeon SCGC-AAA382A20]|uniref:Proteasome subunit beta n=1 Tax=candidate division MSBL1 archaeon SCGC-AAA382A20 TaxID=1698280 RepID=A0A133VJM7_9EURY|nr:hypothetical protein AKJ51_03300 [candidate division MSBL1 archaeon SCGC-AAA382A20]
MEEAFQGTVVGLIYDGGVALASDSRSTRQYLVRSKKAPKIFKIQDRIGVAVSGIAGDARNLVDTMEIESNLYQIRREKPISTKSLARLTSNIFHSRRMFPYIVSVILSGIDKDGPKLYFLDPAGGSLKEDKFASAGTGSSVAYGVLEQNYEENMEAESGLRIAAQSIQQAIERDAATGDNVVLAKIDDEGFQEIDSEKVDGYLK